MNEDNQNIYNNGQNMGQPNVDNYPNTNGYIQNNNLGNVTVTYPNNVNQQYPQQPNVDNINQQNLNQTTMNNQMPQYNNSNEINPFNQMNQQPVQTNQDINNNYNSMDINNSFSSNGVDINNQFNTSNMNNNVSSGDVNNQFSPFESNEPISTPFPGEQQVTPVNLDNSNSELFNPLPRTQVNPYPNTNQSINKEPKGKNKKVFLIIIILLLVILLGLGVFIVLNNNKSTNNNKNNKQVEQKETEETKEENTTETENTEVADTTKTKALEFIQSIGSYVKISTSSSIALQGYDKSVPIATTGDVVCATEDGLLWTGIVADGSESCNNFMNAVIKKANKEAPQEANVILSQDGSVLNNSWIKYDNSYCSYDGTQITTCSATKPTS